MKTTALLASIVGLSLVVGCATQPGPAEPRGAERQPPAAVPRQREAPPRSAPLKMADLLRVVLPEPLQAGKNPITPLDTGPGNTGPTTCAAVCKRVLGDCLVETIMASGKVSQKQIESLRKSGMMDKLRASVQKTCRTHCRDPQKKNYAKFQAMKRCVRERTCTAVGVCAVKYIR